MAWMPWEPALDALVGFIVGFFLKVITGEGKVTEKCMIPTCGRMQASGRRGLCLVCYSKAKKKVEAKETTWENLADMGLCESDTDPFDDAYNRAMRDK